MARRIAGWLSLRSDTHGKQRQPRGNIEWFRKKVRCRPGLPALGAAAVSPGHTLTDVFQLGSALRPRRTDRRAATHPRQALADAARQADGSATTGGPSGPVRDTIELSLSVGRSIPDHGRGRRPPPGQGFDWAGSSSRTARSTLIFASGDEGSPVFTPLLPGLHLRICELRRTGDGHLLARARRGLDPPLAECGP